MSTLPEAFAVWAPTRGEFAEGRWIVAQSSVFTMFSITDPQLDDADEFLDKWPRAGATRDLKAYARESAQEPPSRSVRLWPTPAASLPNDGEEPAQWLRRFIRNATKEKGATRAGVPLAVAARAPVVLLVAKINLVPEALEILEQHEKEPHPELGSTEKLNPRWVEHLMGFPEGWTEV